MFVNDREIIDLYWSRSESAITETSRKYGCYCRYIAFHILYNDQDAEECVNDTYLRAWSAMPPKRPNRLSTFLGKITRNLSIDRYKQYAAEKRGKGQIELALDELVDCVPDSNTVEQVSEERLLVESINLFLSTLGIEQRMVFVHRYWYLSSIKEIAQQFCMSESKVKSLLFRLRNGLKTHLEKEGITV